jgi:hypothetical protein
MKEPIIQGTEIVHFVNTVIDTFTNHDVLQAQVSRVIANLSQHGTTIACLSNNSEQYSSLLLSGIGAERIDQLSKSLNVSTKQYIARMFANLSSTGLLVGDNNNKYQMKAHICWCLKKITVRGIL